MRWIKCIILEFVALPLWILFFISDSKSKQLILEDVKEMNERTGLRKPLVYWLALYKSYRTVFYKRIPRARFYRFVFPGYPSFSINANEGIGGGIFVLNHPFSTIINAKKIGINFTVCQLTTIGNALHGRNDLVPSIGDNVSLGANVTVIGDITVGNNVVVGAGSVVVKDVPSNCVVAGNPAKIIRYINDD